jgi:hypothetical protein
VNAQSLHRLGELSGGRDVGAKDAARDKYLGQRCNALPRSEHVEDHSVEGVLSV